MSDPRPVSGKEVGLGFLCGIGLHLAVAFVCWVVLWLLSSFLRGPRTDFMMPLFFAALAIGITQLIYMVPAILYARRKGRPGIARGIIIVAALTALLNATCFGIFMSGGIRIGG